MRMFAKRGHSVWKSLTQKISISRLFLKKVWIWIFGWKFKWDICGDFQTQSWTRRFFYYQKFTVICPWIADIFSGRKRVILWMPTWLWLANKVDNFQLSQNYGKMWHTLLPGCFAGMLMLLLLWQSMTLVYLCMNIAAAAKHWTA